MLTVQADVSTAPAALDQGFLAALDSLNRSHLVHCNRPLTPFQRERLADLSQTQEAHELLDELEIRFGVEVTAIRLSLLDRQHADQPDPGFKGDAFLRARIRALHQEVLDLREYLPGALDAAFI